MADDLQVLHKLYDNLFDAITYVPGGAQKPAFDSTNSMIQFATNQQINPADFANAFSPMNPTKGDMKAAETFSRFVDAIPNPGVLWSDSTDRVSSEYRNIVQGATTTVQPDQKQLDLYNKAYNYLNKTQTIEDFEGNKTTQLIPSPIYSTYQTNLQSYLAALSSYRLTYNNYNLDDPAQQRDWIAKEPVLKAAVTAAWNNLQQSGAAQVEQALAALTTTINSATRVALDAARQTMNTAALASLTGAGDWFLAYATPSNWADVSAAQNMTALTIDSSNVQTSSSSSSRSWGGGVDASWGLWSVGGSTSGSSGSTHFDSKEDKFKMSAKIGLVRIYRPWFNTAFFKLKNWTVDDMGANGISDGKGKGALPMVTTALIVARDFKLEGSFSSKAVDTMRSAVSGSTSVGWGPFKVSGNYSQSSSSESQKSSFNGSTLTVPGLQVIGYVNSLIPASPPA